MIEIFWIDHTGIQLQSDMSDCGNAAVIWEQLYAEKIGLTYSDPERKGG